MPQSAAAFLDAPAQSAAAFLDEKPAPAPHTTASGLAASAARGAAPYAAGAALGAALGAPFGGVGAVPGALAGIGATALTQFAGDLYDWLAPHFGLGQVETPQGLSDKALDALGIKRPATTAERAAEAAGGFLASLAGVPVAPLPAPTETAARQLLRDFEAHGVSPTIPAVGQGKAAARLTNLADVFPLTTKTIRDRVQKSIGETADAAQRVAESLGTTREPAEIGAEIRNALRRFAEDRSAAKAAFGEFNRQMAGAGPTAPTHTIAVVRDLLGRFPNVPELTGFLTSEPIARLRAALEPRVETTPPKFSTVIGPDGRPIVVREAETVRRGGVISLPELQELRSKVGSALDSPTFGPTSVPRAQLSRLYKALTEDMRDAARARGPAALKAFERAQAGYALRRNLIDRLRPLAEASSDERVFSKLNSAAADTGAANAGLLRSVKRVLPPDEWGDFAASIVARLGEPPKGAQDLLAGRNFSVSSFATNWKKLSTKAKDLLFGPDVAGSPRALMESLARVAQAQQNVGKFANVSRSGEMLANGAVAAAILKAFMDENVAGALGHTALAGGGALLAARLLMSPAFARFVYVAAPRLRAAATSPQALRTAINALVATLAANSSTPESAPR